MPAHQLYPLSRLADMDDKHLQTVLSFALYDAAETSFTTVYDGMTRDETVRAAQQTIADVTAHQNYRLAMAFDRQTTLDVLHGDALAEYASELNRRSVVSYAGVPSATATAANILREIRGK